MKIMAISDLNGNREVLQPLKARVQEEAPAFIVFSGDIVKDGARMREWEASRREHRIPMRDAEGIHEEEHEDFRLYQDFFRTLAETETRAYVIPGGQDAPLDVFMQIANNRESVSHTTHIIHDRITSKFVAPHLRDLYVCGIGGIITENESESHFVYQRSRHQALYFARYFAEFPEPKVLLIHTPPKMITHAGSEIVEEVIDTVRPGFVFCGSPDGTQSEHHIGTALAVCSGRLEHGDYAVLDTISREVHYKKLEAGVAMAL